MPNIAVLYLTIAGTIEPIKSGIRDPKLGIGKQEEDGYFTVGENIQRRKLDIEIEETKEVVRTREVLLQNLSDINYLMFATEVKQSDLIYYFFGNLHLIAEGII